MIKYSVFLIQEDKESLDDLASALDGGPFEVVGGTTSGEEGISRVLTLKPDFLITEIALRGGDGIDVIERIKRGSPDTKTVVLSYVATDDLVKNAMAKGAEYYMLKPVRGEILQARLSDMVDVFFKSRTYSSAPSLEEKISKIFISVGIPPHIKGYSYLREGVKMAVNEPTIINNITKKLYPQIGEKYETTPSKVERAIRHAIEVAWNRGRIDNINNLFGVRAYVGSEKPTNGEFIALVADKMLLEGA